MAKRGSVGVPRRSYKPTKPKQAPIDQFFAGVRSQKVPKVGTPKPKPPPKPKPAKVGPYTKPVTYKAGKHYRTGQPVKLDDGETIVTAAPKQPPKETGARATRKGKGGGKVPKFPTSVIPQGKSTPVNLSKKELHNIRAAAFGNPFPSSAQVHHAIQDVTNIPAGVYETVKAPAKKVKS